MTPCVIPPTRGGELYALLVLTFLLTACTTLPPEFKPVPVDVPVTMPCPAPTVTPPPASLDHTKIDASLFDKVRAALIELDERKAYEAQLTAALAACH
jgi:hypothetical protein